MTNSYLARNADAASYADQLHADLARIKLLLDRYRGSPGIELLCERSHSAQKQLELISQRLKSVSATVDRDRYPLSTAEHVALELACDLRERLVESLARYQRAAARLEHGDR